MDPEEEEDYDSSEEDDEEIDLAEYKGIFFNEEPGQKWQDDATGAHFDFQDMCKRLQLAMEERKEIEKREKYYEKQRQIQLAALNGNNRHVKEAKQDSNMVIKLQQYVREVAPPLKEHSRNVVIPQQGYGTAIVDAQNIEGGIVTHNIHKSLDQNCLRRLSNQPGQAINPASNQGTIPPPRKTHHNTHGRNMKNLVNPNPTANLNVHSNQPQGSSTSTSNTVGGGGNEKYFRYLSEKVKNKDPSNQNLVKDLREILESSQTMARRAQEGGRPRSNDRGSKIGNYFKQRGDIELILESKKLAANGGKVGSSDIKKTPIKKPTTSVTGKKATIQLHNLSEYGGREPPNSEKKEMKESSSSFLDREKKGSQNKSMGGDAKNLLFYTTDGSNRIKNSSSARAKGQHIKQILLKKRSDDNFRTRNISNTGMTTGERKTFDCMRRETNNRSSSISKQLEVLLQKSSSHQIAGRNNNIGSGVIGQKAFYTNLRERATVGSRGNMGINNNMSNMNSQQQKTYSSNNPQMFVSLAKTANRASVIQRAQKEGKEDAYKDLSKNLKGSMIGYGGHSRNIGDINLGSKNKRKTSTINNAGERWKNARQPSTGVSNATTKAGMSGSSRSVYAYNLQPIYSTRK